MLRVGDCHASAHQEKYLICPLASANILLPLAPEAEELSKEDSCSFELRSDPTVANSAKYKKTIRIVQGGETVRQLLNWRQDMTLVLKSMGLTANVSKITMAKTTLRGTALNEFSTGVEREATRIMQAPADAETDPNNKQDILDKTWNHEDHVLPTVAHWRLDSIESSLP